MHSETSVSIWFFIGISLLVNGALIFGAGIYQVFNPPEVRVVLFQYHADVWWGAVLFSIGAAYCYFFLPGREEN
jgi:hypothetical protein